MAGMTELWFDPEADAALEAVEADHSRRELCSRLHDVLDTLEADPGDPSVRRHRFQRPALWCVTVSTRSDNWVILWEPHPARAGIVMVHYVGPASFA